MSNLTPAQLSMRGRAGAHASWANTEDRAARTAAARRQALRRFEEQVDPDRVLDPAERAVRAGHARKAHMLKLAMASAKARRLRAQAADIEAELAAEDPEAVDAAAALLDEPPTGGGAS